MAEASSPHGQIEAKIRSLAQIPDSSHGTDGDQPGNNKQRKGSSQMTQQTDESRDSLGFQDNAVISYQLAADGGRKPTDYCTSPEDKQARGQARLQKKRQARRRKNRSKKEETPENGEHQRVTDGRKDRSTNEKGRSNGSRKQSDRKKTPEALSQKNGFEKAKEEVATGSKNHVSTRDSDQKGDGSIANSNRPSTSQGTVDSTNTVEQEEKNELDIALAEDFILAQNLYYKKEIVKECEKECIFLLKKKSSKFPTAKFFCRLCDYHCFDMEHCESHKKESRHKRLMKMRLIDQLLNHLPYPEPAHKQAVDDTVEKIYEEQHLTDSHLQERRELLGHIQKLIENSYKDDIHLVMYGSSHCTLGLRSSDVNMDFTNNVPPSYLKDAYLQLKENQNYVEDIESDFFAKVPSIRFVVSGMKLRCQLAINNTCCHKTSELLHTYSRIDTRLAKLAVVFRYLAKLCKMDKQEEGTLPSYVFYLMTVFFLQQCKPPVLPVLHEIGRPECTGQDSEDWYFKDVDRLGEYWVGQNQCCVGDLWIQMLRFYCIEFDIGNFVINIRQTKLLTRQEKKWTSKKLAIEDPFMRRRNVANCVSHSQVFEYILEQFKVAYKHFGIPQLSTGPLFSDMAGLNKYLKRREDGVIKHVLTNKDASEDCDGDRCSSAVLTDIRQSEANVVHEKSDMVLCSNSSQDFSIETWVRELVNGIFDAAMEQFASEKCPAENLDDVCGAISLEQMEDSAHQHSSMLSDSHVPCGDAEIFISEHKHSTDDVIGDSPGMTNTDKPVDDSQEKTESLAMDKDGLDGTPENTPNPTTTIGIIKSGDVIEITSTDTMTTSATEDPDEDNVDGDNAVMCPDIFNSGSDTVPSLGDKHTNVLKPVELIFSFDEKHLSDSKGPAIMCSICQREGHLKSSCPEENLPPLSPLPPLGRQYGDALDYLIQKVPKDFKPTEWEMKMRHGVVCEVERDIQETYPGAKLKVFGSSCNGFGFRGSDLDICLTFADMSSLASADPVAIIEQLAKVLKRQKTLYNVFPITTAKVPIVKFKHRPLQLEGDISLYNTLAIENTRMLQLYSAIDRRVVYLGYMMKVLAKICEICDASRGSLSSYAYILMVIYFLQQRQPPVIPVLQELIPKKGKKPEKIIDGWNSWFFDDLSQLPKVWPDYGKNTESPADLWLGLLCFYTEQFSFKEYVISIRQKVPLTKFERLWNTSTIAIEDPFDLSHNLGAGLSRRMNMFIIRTLRNARKLFGTNIYSIPNGYKSLEDYLFDPNLLTDSLPPSDRNCHRCGKIGHFAKECPLVELRKEGEEENRRQRQQQQRQHQQQQQQQWQQQQQAKKKKEMTISTPVPIPQAKAQMSHVHGSPDYARSTVLMSQDYHRGQHTPDSVQQMIRLNARYSPTANKQQHQPVYVQPSPPQGLPPLAEQHIDPACQSVSQPHSLYSVSPQIYHSSPQLYLNSPQMLPYVLPCFPGCSNPPMSTATGPLPTRIIRSTGVQQLPNTASFPCNVSSNQQQSYPVNNQSSQPSNQQRCYPVNKQPNQSSNQQQSYPVKIQTSQPSNQQQSYPVNLQTSQPNNQQQDYPTSKQPTQPSNQQQSYPIRKQTGQPTNQQHGTIGSSCDKEQMDLSGSQQIYLPINQGGVLQYGKAVIQSKDIINQQLYYSAGCRQDVSDSPQLRQVNSMRLQHSILTSVQPGSQQHSIQSSTAQRSTASSMQDTNSQCSMASNLQASNETYSLPMTVQPNSQQLIVPSSMQGSNPGSSQTHYHHNDVQQLESVDHSGHHRHNVPIQSLDDCNRQQQLSVYRELDNDWPALTSVQCTSSPNNLHSWNEQPHSKREARCGKPDKRNPRIFVNRNFKSGPSETS